MVEGRRDVPIASHHTSTEDGHVRLRVDLRRDDTRWKCRPAHLARRFRPGVNRTNVSCRCALPTAGHSREIYRRGNNYSRPFSQRYVETSRLYSPPTNRSRVGQLPYLTHDLVTISSLSGIMTYVSGLPGSSKLGGHASPKENAQRTAWKAHAASTLGDLVVGVSLLRPPGTF